ncbi:hypothetical protein H9L19_04470 [Weissella diestrammenae]|uniref:Cell wall-active antibiotics response LiaF-like C-terminal domain-containing protein n=1 Tax=Weissella diestrammenae TaxID=1162633 RepID=A0A7G9T3L0_9LACO|nr:hypothetical protein [Weissella diestrammenae]MCM0582659.1 hypothetical protein [Weissella diestrammenae]QNN74685.1 hypothetical protein H9L19_04470 [Weissella diestrammenae]
MKHNKPAGKRIVGALLILVAIGIALVNTGVWHVTFVLPIWQYVLMAVLMFIALSGLVKGQWFVFWIPLAMLMTIHQNLLNVWLHLSLNSGLIWGVAILLAFGCTLLFAQAYGEKSEVATTFDNHSIELTVDEIKGQTLRTKFGDLTVTIQPGIAASPVTLNLDVRFGGLVLHVPKDWEVTDATSHSFSQVKIMNQQLESKQVLRLTGQVAFGEVKVWHQ